MANAEYKNWLAATSLPSYLHSQLEELGKDEAWINDAFGTDISFGTAGMRGLLEPGTNRINVVTIGRVTAGLAELMKQAGDAAKKAGVVISYDSRYYSRDFAELAARILGHEGIKVYLFDSLRPTPELSFAIRYLKTYAGIMITASHNAKQYNGYKIYGEDGGQMPPEKAAIVQNAALSIKDQLNIPTSSLPELADAKLLQWVGEDVDQAYLEALKSINVNHEMIAKSAPNMKIVYTPVHGTGKMIYERAFKQGGFTNVTIVPSQAILNPEFPTTIKPNPEYRDVFDAGVELANEIGADFIVATDPDADRLGACVRKPDGNFQVLTGNQIATLISNYLLVNLKESGKLESDYEIVTSVVSSSLPLKIAKSYGIQTKQVLTGFKYIGEEIDHLEKDHAGKFLMGFEESYGYLFKTFNRDKDAMQGALMFFEVAAYYASRNMSVFDGLQEIWQKYGTSCEITKAIEMPGLDGVAKMKQIMEELREKPFTELNGHKVVGYEDYLLQVKHHDGQEEALVGFPKSDVLRFFFDDDTWLALRPSGTEPVIKAYVGTISASYDEAEKLAEDYQATLAKSLGLGK
ncbi:MAG: phospho-sugar mutase [Lactobacillus sp.]|nr:phospho-sugar mutase [Lactobacillus sp.]